MSLSLGERIGKAADNADSRYHPSAALRRQLNKVFPTHWSFLLGEVALYSFIILLLTGVYLTLFFDPSMAEVTYNGVYQPLRGIEMSRAYETALNISFEVRGGLFVRQVHHWAALLFAASIMVHMARIFFTGAFRRPREVNWMIGALLLILAMFEGFFGYSLPDDLLSARHAMDIGAYWNTGLVDLAAERICALEEQLIKAQALAARLREMAANHVVEPYDDVAIGYIGGLKDAADLLDGDR